jgi:GNAT superfamily N-acetyltransferase
VNEIARSVTTANADDAQRIVDAMSTSKVCEDCGATVTAENDDAFGAAFLAHARADHDDWTMYPDVAVTNYGEALLRLTGRRERLDSIDSIVVERVTSDRLDDWLSFFDHDGFVDNPAWAACYCTEPHCVPRGSSSYEVEATPWRDHRAHMMEMLRSGHAHGYLAYVDGRPAGWVNASKRAACSLYRLGAGADPPDDEVIAVACFVIAPPYRRHGVAAALLTHVIDDAPSRGASWVEAYPPTEPRAGDGGNFRGPDSLFLSHRFEAVGQDGLNTVMRRSV